MRRMSNSGGRFAKKTEAEKKSVSSRIKHVISEFTKSIHPPRNKWRNDDIIFLVTSGESFFAQEGWEGTKGKWEF
ncbi:hypothetical protein Tco_0823767 [Tanacetum coccineum]|uniref:Uncharacterized protein n=1 Tax=Tanacetum coccineum TaxID=301880 RepID=A0ABQ5AN89_9ASTR